MELTPDEIYDELRQLRQTAEVVADNIADVASAIQYFTNNLFDEQYNPELSLAVQQLSAYLRGIATAARETEVDAVVLATGPVLDTVNGQLAEAAFASKSVGDQAACDAPAELPELPEMFAWRLATLVRELQNAATTLEAAQSYGEKSAWSWWERHLPEIRDRVTQLEYLEEKAVAEGKSLQPYIEQWGGVPATLMSDQWPEEMVAELEEFQEAEQPDTSQREHEETTEETTEETAGNREPAAATTARQRALFSSQTAPQQLPEQTPAAADSTSNGQSPNGSASPKSQRPYTLTDYRAFRDRRSTTSLTARQWKAEYQWLRESKQTFLTDLKKSSNGKQLKLMAINCGCWDAKRQTKDENALAVYRACLRGFVLGNSIQYDPMAETIEEAIDRIVAELTDEDFTKYDAENTARDLQHKKAIEDPQNLAQFATFVRELGEDKLTDEQHLRRDQLYADLSRKTRRENEAQTVTQFEASQIEELEFSLIEGYHDRQECRVWVVQLSQRVERNVYAELKQKAQQLGGKYSSFKKSETGFQFFSKEKAEQFMALKESDADRSEHLEDRRIYKMTSTAECFAAMAERLEEQSQQTLAADDDKLKNTVRRAEMAASVRAAAREGLASAATLRSLSEQLATGEATYLDGVRHASQISTLKLLLRRAKIEHNHHRISEEFAELSHWDRHQQQQHLDERRLDATDLRYAKYPMPTAYRNALIEAIASCRNKRGLKQLSAKLEKCVARLSPGKEHIEFVQALDITLLEEFLSKAKAAGYSNYWLDDCLETQQRLCRANIHTDHELRAVLAELLPHMHPAGTDDLVVQAEDKLRGVKLEGFFPTPKPVIYEMLEYADIQPSDRVLEPSAGKGDILDAIRQAHPDAQLHGLEWNHTLREVLEAKGYEESVELGDFIKHRGEYDRIVMNPPFEKGADIEHVQHAYRLLAPGGRLVSVMCEGPFFRDDARSQYFRNWLNALPAEVLPLPDDSFQGVEAFRQTGVKTRLVVIDKV